MSCIAIIPVRGGSKGLPGKNKRFFAGKPLLFWTIEAALKCQDIDEVYVSTDCPDMQALACRFGAKAPSLRPPELATDAARSIDAVHHAVVSWANDVETVVMLQVTSPLRTHHDISAALDILRTRAPFVDAVTSVTCASKHPMKAYCLREGLLKPFVKSTGPIMNVNRQQMPCAYQENGAIYAFYWQAHLQLRSNEASQGLLCGLHAVSVAPYIMSANSSHDIDCEEDWRVAEDAFIRQFYPKSPVHVLASRTVGMDYPPFVIADIGIAYDDQINLDATLHVMRIAKAAGAECVKFHMHHESLEEKKRQAVMPRASLSRQQQERLHFMAGSFGLIYLAGLCPQSQDDNCAEFWDSVPGFVVPSSLCTNVSFLKQVANLKKPVLVSVATGLSTDDLRVAVDVFEKLGTSYALLYEPSVNMIPCTSLRRLEEFRRLFPGTVVGFVDESCVNYNCFGSIPLGASILCKKIRAEDQVGAIPLMNPEEVLVDLVNGCQAIWSACKRI